MAAVLEEGYKRLLSSLTLHHVLENIHLEELLIKLILLEGAVVELELAFQ